jgi:predicted restriction endonuclease
MSLKRHCDICGVEVPELVVQLTVKAGLRKGQLFEEDAEALDICTACMNSNPVLRKLYDDQIAQEAAEDPAR